MQQNGAEQKGTLPDGVDTFGDSAHFGKMRNKVYQHERLEGGTGSMRYEVRFTNQFKKDLKLAQKQGRDTDKLFEVIEKLANGEKLDAKYRDHDLTGNYKGCREGDFLASAQRCDVPFRNPGRVK